MALAAIFLFMLCRAFEVSGDAARAEDVEGSCAMQREISSMGRLIEVSNYDGDGGVVDAFAEPVLVNMLTQRAQRASSHDQGGKKKLVGQVTVTDGGEEVQSSSFIQSGVSEKRTVVVMEDLSEDGVMDADAMGGTALHQTEMARANIKRQTPLTEEESLEFEEAFEA
eukprot:TRINITY_DN5916_c0_g1_i1.p1 TRINITY_DN5916_c0_g1~~TRINITY_DN5916_c0_g1_i1.p1  ORF type:complete len:168 (-),score=39.59 TRINITY_DN5916_c0_g1_i1:65-568(-)